MQVYLYQQSVRDAVADSLSLHDTFQVDITNGNLVFIDQDNKVLQYNLAQFHIHSPSEHTINGKYYDVEIHLVHTKTYAEQQDDFGVVGIFFDHVAGGDENNEFIESLNISAMHNNT